MSSKQFPSMLRQEVLKKHNCSCMRCNYNENTGSLHIHHIDHDYYNNDMTNLIVLCANCHYSLHHGKWNLVDIGIHEPELNINSIKRPYKWCTKKKESEYLDEIELLNQTISCKKKYTRELKNKHSFDVLKKTVLIDVFIEYAGLYDLRRREELIFLETVYNAYFYSLLNNIDGWSAYRASNDMMDIIKSSIAKKLMVHEHYATPATSEMAEVAEIKPVI